MHKFLSACLVGLMVCVHASFRIGAADLAIEGVQCAPEPLPFQAVRVKLTLVNRGDKEAKPKHWLEEGMGVFEVKAPGESHFSLFSGHAIGPNRAIHEHMPEAVLNRKLDLTLQPKEAISITMAIEADWGGEFRSREDGPCFAFKTPGTFIFKIYYCGEKLDIQGTTEVVIKAPSADDDKAATKRLGKEMELCRLLISSEAVAGKDMLPEIRSFLKCYAKSQYADYARFALARACLKPVIQKTEERYKTQALELLSEVDLEKFAYGPNVLILMRELAPTNQKAEFKKKLDELYPDAVETILYYAEFMNQTEWAAYKEPLKKRKDGPSRKE